MNAPGLPDRWSLVYKGFKDDICCCEALLRILPDGEFIACFQTGGHTEPQRENWIALRRSTDQGRTWGPLETVLRYPDRACTLTEAWVHEGSVVMNILTHAGDFSDWRNAIITSHDGGRTWSTPVTFSAMPERAIIHNTHVAAWGSWYMPFAHYLPGADPRCSVFHDGSFASPRVGVVISPDQGRTWRASATVQGHAWAEPCVIDLRDGRMAMLIRNDDTGCLWRSDSTDRGRSWSDPIRTDIPNPGSKIRLFRLRDGRIAMLHNPSPVANERNPLSLWISDDDLATWGWRRDLVTFPGWLSYPDGALDADERWMHLVFDYNRHDVIYCGVELP